MKHVLVLLAIACALPVAACGTSSSDDPASAFSDDELESVAWIADRIPDLERISHEEEQVLEAMYASDLPEGKAHLKEVQRRWDQLMAEWKGHHFEGGKVAQLETQLRTTGQDLGDFISGIGHRDLKEMKAALRSYRVDMRKLQGDLELLAWLLQ